MTPFPSEAPSDDELREWLRYNVPILKQLYGAAIRDQTPSHLVKFEQGADDLSDFTRIAPGTAAAAGLTAVQVQMHNRRVAEAEAAKAERAAKSAAAKEKQAALAAERAAKAAEAKAALAISEEDFSRVVNDQEADRAKLKALKGGEEFRK